MKIKSLYLAILMLGLSSTSVLAADGTLKFMGNIGTSSCMVSNGDNAEINVPMGTVPVERLENDINGPAVGFAITLQGCKIGTYYLVLDGTSPSGQENVLALDEAGGDGVAQGVGIKVTDIADNPVTLSKQLDTVHDASVNITKENESGTFYLKAHYYAFDTDNLTAGVANATATFTIIQK
ncbi:type 1 fimbrial protein [Enterobacteriaceae bacterium H4N4]|uniref:Type 1 fimbrial protein n=1 Tax=Silvania confinis TaxID=2926470 RepID=A0A9J6QFZ8_9ENTR|nr:fimbrial protein [Silvania confinis]MCU6668258.1 type 1 fimbrial protein [Silvania confinis]